MIESLKKQYQRKLLTALSEDGNSDLRGIDLLKSINVNNLYDSWVVVGDFWIYSNKILAEALVTAQKKTQKEKQSSL